MFNFVFNLLTARLGGAGRAAQPKRPCAGRTPARTGQRFRPWLESLEDRTVLSGAATHFEVLPLAAAYAGEAASIDVIALDAANHRVADYTGTIQLTDTDAASTVGGAVLPTTYTFTTGDHGSHTFTLTPGAVGTDTITATDTATASITGSADVTVNAAPVATHFLILTDAGNSESDDGSDGCGGQGFGSASFSGFGHGRHDLGLGSAQFSGSSQPEAGVATSVEVIALDASNQVVTNYTGTISLSSTDAATTSGGSALPSTYTFTSADEGEHTFALTPGTAGTETIAASDTNNSITGSVALNVAAAPVVTQIAISIPRTIVVGQATPVTVTALDASNHVVPNYTGTVDLTSSDTAATLGGTALPATYTFTASDHGTHVFTVTFATTGSQTITAADAANALSDTVTTDVGTASTSTTPSSAFHGRHFRPS